MTHWFKYAIIAAIFYGLHQVFTKLAAERIGEGLGALLVEGTATLTIVLYLLVASGLGKATQKVTSAGMLYSALTGVCVGVGTVAFFLLFQKGGPISAIPGILAGGMVIMAVVGIAAFHEPASVPRIAGIVLSLAGVVLLRR